jgi:hypothetical protein
MRRGCIRAEPAEAVSALDECGCRWAHDRERPRGRIGVARGSVRRAACGWCNSMPAEHGVRAYKQKRRARANEAGAQRGEQGAVGVLQPWAADLAPEYMQLVAKNDDLDLLRSRGPERERDQLDAAAERPVDEGRRSHGILFFAEAANATHPHRRGSLTARPPSGGHRELGARSRRRVSAPLRRALIARGRRGLSKKLWKELGEVSRPSRWVDPSEGAITHRQPPQFGLQAQRFEARTEFTHPARRERASS